MMDVAAQSCKDYRDRGLNDNVLECFLSAWAMLSLVLYYYLTFAGSLKVHTNLNSVKLDFQDPGDKHLMAKK